MSKLIKNTTKNWQLTEKCGVVGVVGPEISFADVLACQKALEHRGNGPAGYALLLKNGQIAREIADSIEGLATVAPLSPIKAAICHNRYRTSASTNVENTQPVVRSKGQFSLALGHNGNIPDKEVVELKSQLLSPISNEASDSVILTQLLIDFRPQYTNWLETFTAVLGTVKGAFSIVALAEDGNIYLARDPYGIRPLCLGQKNGQWIAVSETVALDEIKAEYVREVLPGELLCLKADGTYESIIYALNPGGEQRCLLETIYFSKKKSFDGGELIENQRHALGKAAAQRFRAKKIKVNWVVPILNSGLPMAIGAAAELDVPLYQAIGVNGTKRSFIQNSQEERSNTVYQKHVVFDPRYESVVAGKSILLCDDSAVRGTSLRGLVTRIKALKNGPREIHILLGSEPVTNICDLGVDLPNKEDLIAYRVKGKNLADIERKVATVLGVQSVTYLDRDSVETALGRTGEEMCSHCFGGRYPISEERPAVSRTSVAASLKKQKVLFMASGNGTNVETLIKHMQAGRILAQPLGVITNNAEAGVIARVHGLSADIPVIVEPSKGHLKTATTRAQYEAKLLSHILDNPAGRPDVIVLAGWMLILSDAFLKPLADQHIKVINLHPALLSGRGLERVMTSKGKMPEIRGGDAIGETVGYTLTDMPIAGATVHYVQPSSEVDTDKVILKEEIVRLADETKDELAQRIHKVEHRIFPIALQKVLLAKLVSDQEQSKTLKKG